MDDCNLEKLGVKPGKIAPAFHQETLDYSTTVPSNTKEVTLDLLARDSGASYTISVNVLAALACLHFLALNSQLIQ